MRIHDEKRIGNPKVLLSYMNPRCPKHCFWPHESKMSKGLVVQKEIKMSKAFFPNEPKLPGTEGLDQVDQARREEGEALGCHHHPL